VISRPAVEDATATRYGRVAFDHETGIARSGDAVEGTISCRSGGE
jgi:hypothetical protein